jgi:hypothetical protein
MIEVSTPSVVRAPNSQPTKTAGATTHSSARTEILPVKALSRILIALFVTTAFAGGSSAGHARAETATPSVDEPRDADLSDDFAYDVTARFNEVLIANIDATDNALMAIFGGALALGIFAIDKIRELTPENARVVLALLGASACSCLIAYTMSFPLLRGFSIRDGVQPKHFIPDFTEDSQAATISAIEELTRSGEANLAVRRAKKIAAVLAILLLLAGAGVVTVARLRAGVVS